MHLVTGGAGFIGSHLVDALVESGQKVRVLDNFSSGREEFLSHHEDSGRVEIFRADLLDMDAVKKSMQGVEMVHHLCLLYTSPSPRDLSTSRMPSSA